MKIKSLMIGIFVAVLYISLAGVGTGLAATDDGFSVDSIKCGCCDLIETGDPAPKVLQCFGKPDYTDYADVPVNPFSTSEVEEGPEYWFYVQNDWTYRIEILNGVVKNIKQYPPED